MSMYNKSDNAAVAARSKKGMNMDKIKIQELIDLLWERYSPGLRRLCTHKLQSSKDDIEDVITDTFAALAEVLREGTEVQNYQAWLYGVANKRIMTIYSKNNAKKKNELHFIEAVNYHYNLKTCIDIDNIFITDEQIDRYSEEILSSLKPNERFVVEKHHNEGLSMKEIADILGSTEAAVKQAHYRAVRKIRKAVKELFGD